MIEALSIEPPNRSWQVSAGCTSICITHEFTPDRVTLFFCFHRGEPIASSIHINPMSNSYMATVNCFGSQEQICLITIAKVSAKTMLARTIGGASASPRKSLW